MIDPVDFKLDLQDIATEELEVGVPQAGAVLLLVI